MIGKSISHYRIVEELGRGGMGVVYRAEDTKLGRTVALKFLPREFTRDEEAGRRFIHEAQAAAALNHTNICTVYEIDEQDGQSFIAMEYIEGESLREMIAAGPLTLDRAIDIAMQTAAGLAEAHEKDVVHRDIKPANIMIDSRGHVKITDFGMAQLHGGTLLTKEGTTLGTVAYMPPEQAHGGEVDHRADIWSLGVMLYEMVSGRRPFRGEYDQAMIYSILNDDSDPLTALRTGVPPELERITGKCLSKEKEERYQTAIDLIADLRHVARMMKERKPAPMPDSPIASPSRTVAAGRRYRWLLWAALAILAGILAIAIVPRLFRSKPEPAVETTLMENRKMIVVLPFENLGPPDDEYFADGMTDAITARLAGLSGLGVISRQSAIQYKDSKKSTGQIAEELGVDYILEGTIQRERPGDPHSRVRIIPQLIRADDDIHLWAGMFDEEMTEVFRLQSEIAERVAVELGVTLLGRERRSLLSRPTENIEAYEHYLRALEYQDRQSEPDNARKVVELLEMSVETDPQFAVAWALLAEAYVWTHWMKLDQDGLAKAYAAAETALRLDPELPEVDIALGYIQYYGYREFDKAALHFNAALEKRPNDMEAIRALGLIRRRQGRWDEALAHFEKAARINPRDFAIFYDGLAHVLLYLHRFEEAERFTDRAIAMKPDVIVPHFIKALIAINKDGDVEEAKRSLEMMFALATPDDKCFTFPYMEMGALARICYGTPCAFIEKFEIGSCEITDHADRAYHALVQHLCMDDETAGERALEYADLASAEFESDSTDEVFILGHTHIVLGKLYAYLGRSNDALREGNRVAQILPISIDAIDGPDILYELADICMMVGDHEAAIDQLEILLSYPCSYTMRFIDLDPLYEPLRDHPRYKKLIEKYPDQAS